MELLIPLFNLWGSCAASCLSPCNVINGLVLAYLMLPWKQLSYAYTQNISPYQKNCQFEVQMKALTTSIKARSWRWRCQRNPSPPQKMRKTGRKYICSSSCPQMRNYSMRWRRERRQTQVLGSSSWGEKTKRTHVNTIRQNPLGGLHLWLPVPVAAWFWFFQQRSFKGCLWDTSKLFRDNPLICTSCFH